MGEDCKGLGKELLSRNHYASNEIKEKLNELINMSNDMHHRWEERWEHLQLILEVYQFARDAAVAEAWLMAQDPYLKSEELGQTIDEVENLIKKHEAFEKAAAAQEERFAALERLTTFELKELRRKQDEAEDERRRQVEEIARQTEKPDGADRRSETGSIKSGHREGDEVEGMLVRKNEWVNTTTKASNRSWDKVCVVLKGTKLLFYKDQKSYRSSPDNLYRGEPPMELQNGTAEIATDYTKKRHVFRLKLSNGGESLFQASEDDEMSQWVNAINTVADPGTAAGAGRAQTLPAGERRPGDEPKKRSFFTLKKK